MIKKWCEYFVIIHDVYPLRAPCPVFNQHSRWFDIQFQVHNVEHKQMKSKKYLDLDT